MADIGIMGGTFDPIHNGHLMLGRQALAEYGLDEIWYMPSGQPPHKQNHCITAQKDRSRMVCLAIRNIPGFVYSDFEIRRSGLTYSSETLELLQEEYPDHRFSFIIGADSFFELERWHHPWKVMKLAGLLVARREYGAEHPSMESQAALLRQKYGARIRFLHCPETDISSSGIRERIRNGENVSSLLPPAVAAYILEHALYQRKEQRINNNDEC